MTQPTSQQNIETITSISTYLTSLNKLNTEEDKTLFYRGVTDAKYAKPENNVPSIYREDQFISNERDMYYELVAKCPDAFKNCSNAFEHLVIMQHYNYPTRLLDITSNALVALYFACQVEESAPKKKVNGEVILFNIPTRNIRNHESDRVSLLANLAKADNELGYDEFIFSKIIKDVEKLQANYSTEANLPLMRKITNKLKDYFQLGIHNSYNKYQSYLLARQQLHTLILSLQQNTCDYASYYMLLKFGALTNNFDRYTYHICNEKPGFNPDFVNPEDLIAIQCVNPKQNNPRILAQQGAFLLFGLKDSSSCKIDKPIIPERLYATTEIENRATTKRVRFIIPYKNKAGILKELERCGISSATLFPEIDKIAIESKERFRKLTVLEDDFITHILNKEHIFIKKELELYSSINKKQDQSIVVMPNTISPLEQLKQLESRLDKWEEKYKLLPKADKKMLKKELEEIIAEFYSNKLVRQQNDIY